MRQNRVLCGRRNEIRRAFQPDGGVSCTFVLPKFMQNTTLGRARFRLDSLTHEANHGLGGRLSFFKESLLMESTDLFLYTLTRVLHVGTAIVLVGGTFFVRFVLFPAVKQTLSDDVHARLRAAMMGIWKKVVHAGIALLLITGAINYYRVIAAGTHKGDALYHAIMGTKIILALVIFFIASALVGRSAAFEGMRRTTPKWLLVNVLLATIIVAASGFLKVRDVPTKTKPVATAAPERAAE